MMSAGDPGSVRAATEMRLTGEVTAYLIALGWEGSPVEDKRQRLRKE